LLPYIRTLFWEHSRTGAPLMRPLSWHYLAYKLAADIDDQFMFGEHLLVAPVTDRGHRRRTVYFPAGKWYPIQGGAAVDGGALRSVEMPLGTVPAFVREGAILPLADRQQSTQDYDAAAITFAVYGATADGIMLFDDGRTHQYKSGNYSEWKLSYRDGKFSVDKVHNEFQPTHKFQLDKNGARSTLTL
jgi:alpha-glucosidase